MPRTVDAVAQAKLTDAQDGFKARVAPIWTEEKLNILAGYLPAFAKATSKAPGWYALDLFAGGALNYSDTRQVEILGSPLIALEVGPPDAREALKVVMAEKDDKIFAALEHRTVKYGERAVRFHADSNRVIDQMLDLVPKRAPAFAFLDPEGSELEWETVEAIADHKRRQSQTKIEQLILFSESGMVRLGNEYPSYVTRVYGHEDWKPSESAGTAGRSRPTKHERSTWSCTRRDSRTSATERF